MKLSNILYLAASAVMTALAVFDPADALAQSIPISEVPLFSTTQQPPLMMMVMSRDEQLFNKAYPDYTDLDGNGQLDTTYNNAFEYTGYFDPTLCYTYDSGNSRFVASSAATNHQCSSKYSGNFMNWVAMSRLDMLRFVFYGGYRSTDTATTVLERAAIPNDLHAWTKVYTGSDVSSYTPFSGSVSFCNATLSTGVPLMRVALGAYTEWAATALSQCQWREEAYTSGAGSCTNAPGDNSCYDDPPNSAAPGSIGTGGLTVRVQVCGNSSFRESFCTQYTDTSVTPNTVSWKPTGLLQEYGEDGSIRFGLLTGSFSRPRSGGVLRRNIGKFAGNSGTLNAEGCAAGDEVNLKNGRFCNQNVGNSTPEGIVKTMNALKLTKWNGSKWSDCDNYSILNRQGQQTNVTDRYLNDPGSGGAAQNCSAWGNPLSEMYAEALRYITAQGKTAGFNDLANDLAGLPGPTWADPYRLPSAGGNPYCAKCNILVLSTGLNSFDSDEIPTVPALPRSAAASTGAVGTDEGISGTYLFGRDSNGTPGDLTVGASVATHTDLCTAKSVTDFSNVRGICPDIPSMEGSYLIDGLAFDAYTTDLRPGLPKPDGTGQKPATYKNTAKTYAVSLAENLPKFTIPIGTGALKLAPLAQANNTGTSVATDGGWRSSFLGSVTIGSKRSAVPGQTNYIYGRDLETDGSAASFTFVWEDSLWGNDHDNDVVQMLTYCVGAKCDKASGLPMGVCFYTATNFGGSEFCPTTAAGNTTANMPTSPVNFSLAVQSVRVPTGRTLTLYTSTGQSGTSRAITGDVADLGTGTTGRSTAKSYKITGGNVPVAYSGKDICWRANGTTSASPDYSAVCGANGTPTVGANEALVRVENLSAYAGNAMLTGYTMTGSNDDGVKRLTLRPGNANGSIVTQTVNPPSSWYKPMVLKFSVGTASAKQFENPLFYAAKYGSFDDNGNSAGVGANNGKPDEGEWDKLTPGVPDNFFAVTNPAKLKQELKTVFDATRNDAGTVGSAAASGARFVPFGTLAYQALYSASDWTGDLKAWELNSDGSLGTVAWSASARLAPAASRNIFTAAPSGTPPTFSGVEFTTSGLTTAMQAQVMTGLDTSVYNITDVVAFLRGDQSKETNRTPPGPFRPRSTRIGDILDSNPAVQFRTGYGYQNLPETVNSAATGSATYAEFIAAKPTDPVVYVGANDGMLHAFNGISGTNGGKELFAYVPNAVLSKLGRLAQPSYAHTYYVDGTPTLGDIYDGAGWRTLLIGATGAGARSVFGLDVTDPGAFDASSVLWEFNDQDDTDMGYGITVPSLPTIAADGRWIVAFGNGYNSARNHAELFVLDALAGTKIAEVDTGSGGTNASTDCPLATGPADCPNGLASAVVVDSDIDGTGDTIYAGDYLGNLWKFTCTPDTTPLTPAHPTHLCTTGWLLGHNAVPLIKAQDADGNRQPVTSGIYAIHNPLGGTLVYFGTGKYLATDDANPALNTVTNSIYAVWDSPYNAGTTLTRADLMQQTITDVDTSTGLISVSSNLFDYEPAFPVTGGNSKMGWYLDLQSDASPDPIQGERVVAAPTAILGELLVNTFRPTGDICAPGGVNSFFELDLLSGAAALAVLPGGGGGGGGIPPGTGGEDIGTGPPLGSPNPVISIPGVPEVPGIGCPPNNPNCVTPQEWCVEGMIGYPNCAPCQEGSPDYPGCTEQQECKWLLPGTSVGNPIACRVSWRQLR